MIDWWLGTSRCISYVGMIGVFVLGVVVWHRTAQLEEIRSTKTDRYATARSRLTTVKIAYYVFGFFVLLSTIGQSHLNARKEDLASRKVDTLLSQNIRLVEGQKGLVTLNSDLVKGNKQLVTGQSKVVAQNSEIVKGKDELVLGKNRLLCQNAELLERIAVYERDLRSRDAKIRELENKAKKASRGITTTYAYNGARMQTSAGRSEAIAGPEIETYTRMVELEQAGRLNDLMTLCKKEIKETPEWLTPHMFLGAAYAKRGQKENAISEFEYVVDKAAGDPEYTKAAEYLRLLKQK